jgi:NitT/TauT family transport system substrate-binding protein
MAEGLKKVTVSMMNAIHDLPLLVARDEGFFNDEGLDVVILKTPGTAQSGSDHQALQENIFSRTMESLYDKGECDQFRMCEWGIMKRAVESNVGDGHRPAQIVALGSAMSAFAIVVNPSSGIYEPEQLKNQDIAVSPFNGSHFTTLKMLEGFIKRGEIKTKFAGTMRERLEAVRDGKEKACVLNEPWISVAEKWGMRILMESHSARAAAAIQNDPGKFVHYLIEEAGGLLEEGELKLSRILNAPPVPYTKERFDDNYNWTKEWGLVADGATFENTVDNRAWQ